MLEVLVFINVCAPFAYSDCEYTVIIYPDQDYAWGKYHFQTKTLFFGGDFWYERDCWGNSYWEHEWLHAHYGNWHWNGVDCLLR